MRTILFLLILFPVFSKAQDQQLLEFESTTHDFGTIKEEDGAVEHDFTFVNKSGKPIVIRSVRASCGCTTPDWTRDTIAVDGTGFVRARYNTRNRPGTFNKNLTVYINLNGMPYRLYIKGKVLPRVKTIEEELPTSMGALRTRHKVFNMGKINSNQNAATRVFPVYNQGDSDLIFMDYQAPEYIDVKFSTDTLKTKSKGNIQLIYNAEKKNDLGFMNDNVTVFTNEIGTDSIKSFSVYTNIHEYFPAMTREKIAEAPYLVVSKDLIDKGHVARDSKVEYEFKIENKGKSTLELRKIELNCPCLSYTISKESIAPGESVLLKVVFDTVKRRGNQQKAVAIYSNSPKIPIKRLNLRAYVESN